MSKSTESTESTEYNMFLTILIGGIIVTGIFQLLVN